ncbi:GNAT family N-acetyltransferase [Tropicimonas sp. IMCC6043]|uniref:GNAT family N-acetyltransferase n=1 Tax=Tropicimonas sp. IMCC6043 TaxID=2510645 RepID=UPI0013EC286F|nr:GNAT family N-acetyltransferase [Tropicimonas sp. IMCC6043]
MQVQEISAGAPVTRIRRARSGDAPRLMEMIAALAAHHGDAGTPSLRAIERDLLGRTACGLALVAEHGPELAGYAVLTAMAEPQWGRRRMELTHLFVAPEARGAGIGRQLVAAAVAEARSQDCGRMTVGTHPDNRKAQALYTSLGFTPQASAGKRFQLELPAGGALPAGWV